MTQNALLFSLILFGFLFLMPCAWAQEDCPSHHPSTPPPTTQEKSGGMGMDGGDALIDGAVMILDEVIQDGPKTQEKEKKSENKYAIID